MVNWKAKTIRGMFDGSTEEEQLARKAQAKAEFRQAMADAGSGIKAAARSAANDGSFSGVVLRDGVLYWHGQEQPAKGANVAVEDSGQVEGKVSAGRVIAGTVLAPGVGTLVGALAKKQVHGTQLRITGTEFEIVVPVLRKEIDDARKFAAKVKRAAS